MTKIKMRNRHQKWWSNLSRYKLVQVHECFDTEREMTDDGVSIDDFMIFLIACLKGESELCHKKFHFSFLRRNIKFNGMTFRLKTLVEY